MTPSEDENARLRPLADQTLTQSSAPAQIHLEPYGIEFWSLEPLHWSDRILAKRGLAP